MIPLIKMATQRQAKAIFVMEMNPLISPLENGWKEYGDSSIYNDNGSVKVMERELNSGAKYNYIATSKKV
jgi:hypothetical protein